jgi:hypothetical protein
MMIHFSTPTSAAIDYIAAHMCAEDVAELEASGWSDPLEAIKASIKDSDESFIASWHGKPQCVFGVGPYPKDDALGVPWMLSTGRYGGVEREFMQVSRKWISEIEPGYGCLFNFVDARHVRAQRWLSALGFEPMKSHEFNNHQFIEFGRFPKCA